MPTMPTTYRAPNAPAPKERLRKYDSRRGSSSARGYGSRWRRERRVFLNKNPLCVVCLRQKKTKIATVVDHLIGHNGRNHLFWNQDNWQPLCASHHDVDKQKSDRFANTDLGKLVMPSNLLPSKPPLTIVCGPSGAGKSTFVSKQASCDDVVIDLDLIMSSEPGFVKGFHSGASHRMKGLLDSGLLKRNELLAGLADDASSHRAWFVVSAPHEDDRRRWAVLLKPEKIVCLATPLDECLKRISNDVCRTENAHLMKQWASDWWSTYHQSKTSLGPRLEILIK